MLSAITSYVYAWLSLSSLLLAGSVVATLYENDTCEMRDQSIGICKILHECTELADLIKIGKLSLKDPIQCGYKGPYELVCCPLPAMTESEKPNIFWRTLNAGTQNSLPSLLATRTERACVAACRIIEENLRVDLVSHILGGTDVGRGEYPHLVAIGYRQETNDDGNFTIHCGGSLIHERFVLTAAHCVFVRGMTPVIVYLGVANFDEPEEWANRVEVPIKNMYLPENYTSFRIYNDIGLIELATPVKFNRFIAPACLWPNMTDPDTKSELYVSGWGLVNQTTRARSQILQKARLIIEPIEQCNKTYAELSLYLEDTQFCATDPDLVKDACTGDSGGPFHKVIDEGIKNFRIVGVISKGIGCANKIPALYTKVGAYLDFIESVVWPEF